MGSELVSVSQPRNGGKSDTDYAPYPIDALFCKHLPYYLSIGMTYDQYWYGDCRLTRYYKKAHEIKKERKNQELWLQGAYFYEALADVAPVLRAFAKNGTKPIPYVSEPFALTDREAMKRRERKARLQYDTRKAKIAAWLAETNMRFATREVNSDE